MKYHGISRIFRYLHSKKTVVVSIEQLNAIQNFSTNKINSLKNVDKNLNELIIGKEKVVLIYIFIA